MGMPKAPLKGGALGLSLSVVCHQAAQEGSNAARRVCNLITTPPTHSYTLPPYAPTSATNCATTPLVALVVQARAALGPPRIHLPATVR